jgi:CheY-like chemotaxis protein
MSQSSTILLADDNPDEVFLVRQALKEAGLSHDLVIVTDGDEALHYLMGQGKYVDRQRFPLPALLLLDLEMPVLNGFELLSRLRRNPEFKELPIVVFTNSSQSPDVTRSYRLGANSFLTKPSDIKQLTVALRDAVHFWTGQPLLGRGMNGPGASSHPRGLSDGRIQS